MTLCFNYSFEEIRFCTSSRMWFIFYRLARDLASHLEVAKWAA